MAKKPKPLTSKRVDLWKKATRNEVQLLADIQTDLLRRKAQGEGDYRDTTKLHPSAISHTDWCPRFSYYEISGEPTTNEGQEVNFNLENIFEEGKDIHKKWQRRIDNLGVLSGMWKCHNCENYWWDTSPRKCPKCKTTNPKLIEYKEVPLQSDEFLIIGHADGEVGDKLVEVKSIGLGTLRFEAPALLERYTIDTGDKKVVDLQGLWNNIKRPFPSHTRQGMIYGLCKQADGITHIIFIYEFKPTQQVKAFVLRYNPELIEDVLDKALEVKYALRKKRPPERPKWAEDEESPICNKCVYNSTCWGVDENTTTATETRVQVTRKISRPNPKRRIRSSKGKIEEVGTQSTEETRGRRNTVSTKKTLRINRRSVDEPIRPSNGLGGLLKRATRNS